MKHSQSLIRILPDDVATGVEVGVWRGANAERLLRAFPRLELAMVDPYTVDGLETMSRRDKRQPLDEIAAEAEKRTRFASDRRTIMLMTSENAARNIVNGSLDFVFIDGCHLYEEVAEDIRLWFPKVRDGGVIAGHDYVRDYTPERRNNWDVGRAVDEFAARHDLRIITESGQLWWAKILSDSEKNNA